MSWIIEHWNEVLTIINSIFVLIFGPKALKK